MAIDYTARYKKLDRMLRDDIKNDRVFFPWKIESLKKEFKKYISNIQLEILMSISSNSIKNVHSLLKNARTHEL